MKNSMHTMPRLDSNWMSEAHYERVHKRKPTHFPNGVARPATTKKKQELVDKWTPTK